MDPLADVVADQYEKWIYPAPILDIPAWLENNWQWFDPSHSARVFWPDRDYWPGMDILVAGCGTNQAAELAYTNPQANIVAIDVSQSSLNHHQYLADKYAMKNLTLHRLPIEEVGTLGLNFDLIITTGVLHHMADPDAGARALAECLRPDGVMAVMLYAKYGRLGVEMMQGVFRDLGLGQDEQSLALVKDGLAQLRSDHPVASYVDIAPDLKFDAGLVDTFLHGRERDYTVGDCLDLVASAGLVFQDWFLNAPYYAPMNSGTFYAAVAALPREQQWAVMERINARNACHFFFATRPERPRDTYAIDFSTDACMAYVPSFRHGCRLDGSTLIRSNWQTSLGHLQTALAGKIDGRRSISEISTDVSQNSVLARGVNPAELDAVARSFFQWAWQLDFVSMGISSDT